ncbi:MAG: glycoside hydrolase [Bacteroidaceae bacterium]|nr:glycoside hydrolase [Bacteroidaceae bacterium]
MAGRIYQSTKYGEELDKAIDYMNSHEQAIQEGLQEIENAGIAKKEEISGITQAQAVGYTPSSSSGLSSRNVQDALNEAGKSLGGLKSEFDEFSKDAFQTIDELTTAVDDIDQNVKKNTQKLSELQGTLGTQVASENGFYDENGNKVVSLARAMTSKLQNNGYICYNNEYTPSGFYLFNSDGSLSSEKGWYKQNAEKITFTIDNERYAIIAFKKNNGGNIDLKSETIITSFKYGLVGFKEEADKNFLELFEKLGDVAVTVKDISGNEILPNDFIQGIGLNGATGVEYSISSRGTTNYIEVRENQVYEYNLPMNSATTARIVCFDIDKNPILSTIIGGESGHDSGRFTIPKGVSFIRFSCQYGAVDNAYAVLAGKIQLIENNFIDVFSSIGYKTLKGAYGYYSVTDGIVSLLKGNRSRLYFPILPPIGKIVFNQDVLIKTFVPVNEDMRKVGTADYSFDGTTLSWDGKHFMALSIGNVDNTTFESVDVVDRCDMGINKIYPKLEEKDSYHWMPTYISAIKGNNYEDGLQNISSARLPIAIITNSGRQIVFARCLENNYKHGIVSYSDDNGNTWTSRIEDAAFDSNPSAIYDDVNNKIYTFKNNGSGVDVYVSSDEANSFQFLTHVDIENPLASIYETLDKSKFILGGGTSTSVGIRLSNGTLCILLRFYIFERNAQGVVIGAPYGVNAVLYSTNGTNWVLSQSTPTNIYCDEGQIVEYAPNRVMINSRGGSEASIAKTKFGRRIFVQSGDNLMSGWSIEPSSDNKIYDAIVNASLKKVKVRDKDVFLFSNCYSPDEIYERKNLILYASIDAIHWRKVVLMTPLNKKVNGYCSIGYNRDKIIYCYEDAEKMTIECCDLAEYAEDEIISKLIADFLK